MFWAAGALLALRGKWHKTVCLLTVLGLLVFGAYIALMWHSLERPPLRTMGETRLWYSFFLPLVGLITYSRWRYRWILLFSTLLSAVFICINLLKPEIHDKVMMPALQSPWFAPHVIIYMFAYATTGVAALMSLWQLFRKERELSAIDNLTRVGWSFLTVGMLFGALWAKEAWGTYWSWDPKETWA
ncbi:MAG: cytochrome c biogenesis protein CcsA, partial [Bacteroidaceae bacterium]|nr:cytochrome c biogenesis protein CcsA [Bacteroidaceae bacterium]